MTGPELGILARERIADAKGLLSTDRFAGAFYICGYAVECALKSRICTLHGWEHYYSEYSNLKTHNLVTLLRFSGMESNLRGDFARAWEIVRAWSPEIRYAPELFTLPTAQSMIEATETIVDFILSEGS